MSRIIQIDERAPPSVKTALDNGELSINKGYNITRLLEELPEDQRETAAARAVELARNRQDYRAAFDLTLDDMNQLLTTDEDASVAIREALDDGTLSVNGGNEVARIVLDMPDVEREACATRAGELAAIEADYHKELLSGENNAQLAKQYSTVFEKVALLPTEERDVRTWIEWSGIRKDEIADMIAEADEAAEKFAQIADILRKIHEQEVAPYECDDETADPA